MIGVLSFMALYFLGLNSSHCLEDEGKIKLITYNIRLDHDGDGVDNWHFRKKDLVEFLINEDPDFIGIQEGLWHQVQYMDSMMIEYQYIGVGRDDGIKEGEIMAIFFRKKDWSLQDQNTYWLSDQPYVPSRGWDAACNRTLTHGVFSNRHNDQVISISNTHLDHVGHKARENSITQLKDHLGMIDKEIPSVLMGDFNFTPDSDLYSRTVKYIEDSYSVANTVIADHPGTFNGFRIDPPYERRIDYIFVKAEHLDIVKHRTLAPMNLNGRHLSDHLPVIVECNIQPKKK